MRQRVSCRSQLDSNPEVSGKVGAVQQSLGSNAEYVILEAAGKNALDFHIAYYIGVLSSQEPTAFFHIISKDSGFDPLIKHLKDRKVIAQRSACIQLADLFSSLCKRGVVKVEGAKVAYELPVEP